MERLPEWANGLRGGDQFGIVRRGGRTEFVGRQGDDPKREVGFRRTVELPTDLRSWAKELDPLIPAHVVAQVIDSLQVKLRELVGLARDEGHSWARIGAALGVSRQAAWEAYRETADTAVRSDSDHGSD